MAERLVDPLADVSLALTAVSSVVQCPCPSSLRAESNTAHFEALSLSLRLSIYLALRRYSALRILEHYPTTERALNVQFRAFGRFNLVNLRSTFPLTNIYPGTFGTGVPSTRVVAVMR